MSGLAIFNTAVFVVVVLCLVILHYTQMSTVAFKQARVGILVFGVGLVSFVNVIEATAETKKPLRWFTFTELYGGLDYTRGQSPQCLTGSSSDRITSNGGIRQNVIESYDRNFQLNARYTHHSCAFNRDRNTYDALGLELVYRFTWR